MPPQLFVALLASPWLLLIYSLGCVLVAWYGKDSRIGYWGFLILAFVITPVLAFIFLFFSTPAKKKQ